MTFDEFVNRTVSLIRAGFSSEMPTVERYVKQFSPNDDAKVTYNAPACFIAPVSAVSHTEQTAYYDLDWTFAAVIVVDELDQLHRDELGWEFVERFNLLIDGVAGMDNQCGIPRIASIFKTDRLDEQMNAGYSYWTVTWVVPYRLSGISPGAF